MCFDQRKTFILPFPSSKVVVLKHATSKPEGMFPISNLARFGQLDMRFFGMLCDDIVMKYLMLVEHGTGSAALP